MSEQFYSEYGCDKWIAANLPLPEQGIYVDVGCAWPDLRSNTAFLRDREWTGLAIDGNPFWAPYWTGVTRGKFINALISSQPVAQFDVSGPPDMSRIVESSGALVPCRSLGSILNDHLLDHIDFLSMDCEGHEFDVLMSMNVAIHRPEIVISEFNTAGIGEDFRVKHFLESVGYAEVHRTIANIVYTK